MHTVAFVFKRIPEMSIEDFLEYYEKKHGPLMVEILKNHGLVAYDHYPTRAAGLGDEYVPEVGPDFDAISIYTFETAQQAADAWTVDELKQDSMNFIDFDTMVTLPLSHRQIFPQPSRHKS